MGKISIKRTWHKKIQAKFDNNFKQEVKLCGGKRRADILIDQLVIEVQHSPISLSEVNQRNNDYNNEGYSTIWIVDVNGDRSEIDVEEYLITLSQSWTYESFRDTKNLLYEADGLLYKPIEVAYDNIFEIEIYQIDEFISDLRKKEFRNSFKILPKLNRKINSSFAQRGAGSGKTYESIQMIKEHYDTYVYLSKAHSAKHIINLELKSQLDNLGYKIIDDFSNDKKNILHSV